MLALSISHEARPAMLGPPEGGIEWAPFRSRPTKPKTYRSWRTERRRDGGGPQHLGGNRDAGLEFARNWLLRELCPPGASRRDA
jgi:hypothetical protein